MGILKQQTLKLVKECAAKRGLRRLAHDTGITYSVINYMARTDNPKLDVDVCECLYEHLSGKKLNLVDHVQ